MRIGGRSLGLTLLAAATLGRPSAAAPVLVGDAEFDLGAYDVLEIETGDVTPLPEPDGLGRIAVTRETPGTTGSAGDFFARIEIVGYDTTGSTGYGQMNAILLLKEAIDPAAAGGFASLTYRESSILLVGAGQGQATGPVIKQGDDVYIRTVAYTPSTSWTPAFSGETAITPDSFSHLVGTGPTYPDLSATGAPFQIGVFRATSGPAPSAGGTRTAGLDDWAIALHPTCTTADDCGDDGTGCTTETCPAGLCVATLLACDDGNPCTLDQCDLAAGTCPFPPRPDGTPCDDLDYCDGAETCQDGACTEGPPITCDDGDVCTTNACDPSFGCQTARAPTFDVAFEKVEEFLALIAAPCDGDPLVRKIRKKIAKRIAKVRAKMRKAERKPLRIEDLLYGTGPTFLAVREFLTAQVEAGRVSPACAAAITAGLGELQACVYALVRPFP